MPNIRPLNDVYDSENHTYRYFFTASSSSIYVGFSDGGGYLDHGGTVSFALYESDAEVGIIEVNDQFTNSTHK